MATYLILNVTVIALVCLALWLKPRRPRRPWTVMLVCLLVLTLVFDNIMIALGLFTYAPDKILGVHAVLAPIEDFMYPLLAALLVPALWNKLGERHAR
ncbi:lycopene cyclase domain-containing protein [Candidatus Saccharibacteria bacterium]|nr:lycopene cyclase domain-containing protein [Candidatus Saccharibacteria bacterium]